MPARRLSSGVWKSTSWPSTVIRPSSGRCTPVRHLISVDLPAPLSPTIAVISPLRAAIDAPRSAVTLPKRLTIPSSTRVSVATAVVIAGTS
jgi:hypothetical protein